MAPKTHHLDQHGFILREINQNMPTIEHHGFRNGWVFGDTRAGLWAMVNDVFLVLHPGCRRSDFDIGLALGYLVRKERLQKAGEIWYEDEDEQEQLSRATGEEVCCGWAFEYKAADKDEESRDIVKSPRY